MTHKQYAIIDATMNKIHDKLSFMMTRTVGYQLTEYDTWNIEKAEDEWDKLRDQLLLVRED